MKVSVPQTDPGRAPGLFLGMPVSGAALQALAQRSVYLHANHMLRTAQVIVRGYVTGDSEAVVNQPSETDKVVRIPFWTSAKCTGLGVAIAIGYVERDAYIQALVKEGPTPTATVATPGSGDLVDPGCEWYQDRGHIPFVVEGNHFIGDREGGAMWIHTGNLPPPGIIATDPPTAFPRTLKVPANTELEIEVSYDKCVVCSIFIVEFRAEEITQ